jgi:hypothetical protein
LFDQHGNLISVEDLSGPHSALLALAISPEMITAHTAIREVAGYDLPADVQNPSGARLTTVLDTKFARLQACINEIIESFVEGAREMETGVRKA